MKTVGLIGGLSWRTTVDYYALICQQINDNFDNNTNPPLWIYTLDQRRVHDLQLQNNWDGIAEILLDSILEMEKLGNISAIALLSNTPHLVFEQLQSQTELPILHIADAVGRELAEQNVRCAGLLGTRYTMEKPFIKNWLSEKYDVKCYVPQQDARETLQQYIYDELSIGVFSRQAKGFIRYQIESLIEQDVETIILGCTDLPPLVADMKLSTPMLNSTECHARAISKFILS